jgi:NADPH2:quinone reductase
MRAIVTERFGGPERLVLKELPRPEPIAGHVMIEARAFGINGRAASSRSARRSLR